MESFKEFIKRNAGWDPDSCFHTEKEWNKNYEIAMQVEKTYNEMFKNIKEPKIGDIVEFTNGFRVYKNAKIVENLYHDGKLCICENGSSHTDGKYFSTSGGSFVSKDKSLLQPAGEDFNVVWTWGCNGAGAFQGIYFPLKVRKWIIPYNPKEIKRSIIYFKKNDDGEIISVSIENSDCMYSEMVFNSLHAFEAWANYVGYEYRIENGRGFSNKKLSQKCWTTTIPKPENGKPIRVLANGKIHDGLVVTEEFEITQWWPNLPEKKKYEYGTPEYRKEMDEEIKKFHKYSCNPMGV